MKNEELGKLIWNSVRTDLDFETWYKECFGACVEDAAKLIWSGCAEYPKSSCEIPRIISKDGNTHNFDFDEENFIEYYGEEQCFHLFPSVERIVNDLISYAAGSGKSEFYNNEQSDLFAEFDREWQNLPCDAEGATAAQNAEQDKLLDEYARKIMECEC